MKKLALLFKLFLVISLFTITITAQNNKDKPTSNITGHYIFKKSNVANQLDIKHLNSNKIKFHLTAILITGSDSPHNGEIEAEIELKDNVAVYKEGSCKITLKFSNNKVQIAEENVDDCGFGAYVTAEGIYTKKSNKPIFSK
ncbi:MAG: hypothetical protein HY819_16565 [Acidobacteria bacterium]|nr:hypothetical protein [Acidobacteriota bacterium]